MQSQMQWDIFCQVIDNFGDIGVCWRLACDLAGRGQTVRLWIDDASALTWMAPQGCCPGVQVRAWGSALRPDDGISDVLIEAFGCEPAADFIATIAARIQGQGQNQKPPVWINLEYLSAERYVERCHGLPSPVQHGPAAGWTKWFFYPGFTAATGGLLREPDLQTRQTQFDKAAWRQHHPAPASLPPKALWLSLFCYEPPGLLALLASHPQHQPPIHLLVTPGRASAAIQAVLTAINPPPTLAVSYLSTVPQADFDEMLWACDLNLVRGEDSLVRALWAGQALVWHVYPQEDDAHHAKLHAFLDWLQAPPSLRQFHAVWNGLIDGPLPALGPATLQEWRDCVCAARARLEAQEDLLTQLLGFCAAQR